MPRFPAASPAIASMQGAVYSALAQRAASSGQPVHPFHIGDTYLSPATGCRMEDLRESEIPGLHRYGPVRGQPALVDAIVDRVRTRTGEPVERDQVLLTSGATGGLAAIVGALVAPGEEVLLIAPYWPLIAGIVRTFSGRPIPVTGLENQVPTPAEITAALAARIGPKTVAVYVNTPNNPTGRLLPLDVLEAIARFAHDHDLWLLADEVYEDYVYRGEHVYTRPLLPDRTVAAYSFSKAYGMAGNRAGYVVGPAGPMAEVAKVGIYAFYSAPTSAQFAALRALEGPGDAWVAAARTAYEATGAQAAAILGVDPPGGSTFLFLDLRARLGEGAVAPFLERCADRGILLAPGDSFGPFPDHVRVCYTAEPPEATLAGIRVLRELLG